MTRETFDLGATEVRFSDEESGDVEARSPFNVVDSFKSTFAPSAFASAVGKRVPMLLGHDPNQVIGSWHSVRAGNDALHISGRLNLAVERAREVRALIRAGDLPGVSVGFKTIRDERQPGGVRRITDAQLMEVSFVTFPSVPGAAVTSVRADLPDFAAFTDAVRRAAKSLKG